MVPDLAIKSLLSGENISEAGYISVCDGNKVNLYDSLTARIKVSEEAVLKGWFCPHIKMWRIPLKVQVTDLNRHPLILDSPNGTESKNPFYVVPTCAHMPKHTDILKKNRPAPSKAINNVYK